MRARRPLSNGEYRIIFSMVHAGASVGDVVKAMPSRDEQTIRRACRAFEMLSRRGMETLDSDQVMQLAETVLYGATGSYMMTVHQKLMAWKDGRLGNDGESAPVRFEVMPQVHRNMAKLNVENLTGAPVSFKATGLLIEANVPIGNLGLNYPIRWLGTKSESVDIVSRDVGVLDVVVFGRALGAKIPFGWRLQSRSICLHFMLAGNIEAAPDGFVSEACQSLRQFKKGNRKHVEILLSVSIYGTSTINPEISSKWESQFLVGSGNSADSIIFEQLPTTKCVVPTD